MFESLGEKFEGVFRKLRGQKQLTDDNIREAVSEVRMALLEADVNYLIVKDFVAKVREEAVGQEIIKGVNPAQQLFSIVHKGLVRMMGGEEGQEEAAEFAVKPGKETIILMLGLQGAGKTTFCGKLAFHLAQKGAKPLLVACDIYRPAAIEQLKQVGGGLGFPVFEMGTGHSPVEIVRKAREHAKAIGCDAIVVDTAGRLHIDEVRMDELVALRNDARPDYTFLVADAMTGQDAVNSAKAFNDQVGVDGVCLTKLDGDARGGAALSIKAVTGKPIVFVGVGEKPGDLERFHPDRAAQRILGMGDVTSLVEKAQEAFDEDEAKGMQEKLAEGKFTYNDFIKQMKMINRMGSLKGLLGMLPGVGSLMKEIDNDMLTREFKRVESMILSMTKQERENPELVREQGKRRDRIAKGSGHSLKQVNELVKQFEQMRAMMQQLSGGGMFGGLKAAMGGGAPAPDPSQILAGGGPPKLPPGMDPSSIPGMPKKYAKAMKRMEGQQRGSSYTAPKKKKKKR